jgi:hypothetical protein
MASDIQAREKVADLFERGFAPGRSSRSVSKPVRTCQSTSLT